MAEKAVAAAELLKKKDISISVINMEFVKPPDREKLARSAEKYPLIITLEDNVLEGGAGETIRSVISGSNARIINIGWPDMFIEHGTCDELYRKYRMGCRVHC